MTPDTLYKFGPPLIALQIAALGWRINREMSLGYAERAIFLLVPDVLNVMSLFASVICLIVLPVVTETYFWLSRMILTSGYMLIAFYPLATAAHYRLWSRRRTRIHPEDGCAYPYVTGEELVAVCLSVISAVSSAAYVEMH
ncbi:hypothetical protein [Terracidiphilus gabretensis]|uniref:hypothetical protein n=1 Tax=Terracidiphilus gabretensis TaxID=1577687 RepID=UPI00071B9922|nr:hypothetical protein [Terracidiphilus gabretensis]